jgi:hypothetical protein
MTHDLRRAVTEVSPLHTLFVTALLACFGSSEEVPYRAAEVFRRGALPLVWASLGRHSTARISWLRLTSITHEAVERFLHEWPNGTVITVESMVATLDRCTFNTATRVAPTTVATPVSAPMGILSLLEYHEQLRLLQTVQAALTPDELCALSAAIERERHGSLTESVPDAIAVRAMGRMELLLLGASEYTLSASTDVLGRQLAA